MTTRNYQKSEFTPLNFSKKNLGGFTLIETLVAIAILLIAIIGPISLIGDALHRIYYAKDEMIALNLAQEGIEVMRQWRDTQKLQGVPSFFVLPNGSYTFDVVDIGSSNFSSCNGCDQKIYFDPSMHLYRQKNVVGATPTQFSRILTVSGTGNERKVTSQVDWRTGGGTGTISASEYLFKTF